MIRNQNGELKPKKMLRGWDLLMRAKDQSLEWVTLKEAKESFPIQLAKYAVANHLTEEPAFKWWVPHVLHKWNQIISKVKSHYWQMTHKFGIKLPLLIAVLTAAAHKALSGMLTLESSDIGTNHHQSDQV